MHSSEATLNPKQLKQGKRFRSLSLPFTCHISRLITTLRAIVNARERHLRYGQRIAMRYVRQTMLHMKAGVPTLILNERVDPGTVRMGVSSIERNAIFGRRIALALAWNTTERQKHLFTFLPCIGWIALDSAVILGVIIYG